MSDPLHTLKRPDVPDVRKAGRSGGGWEPIPGGFHGGFRRRHGAGYEYWYPTDEHRDGAVRHHAERADHVGGLNTTHTNTPYGRSLRAERDRHTEVAVGSRSAKVGHGSDGPTREHVAVSHAREANRLLSAAQSRPAGFGRDEQEEGEAHHKHLLRTMRELGVKWHATDGVDPSDVRRQIASHQAFEAHQAKSGGATPEAEVRSALDRQGKAKTSANEAWSALQRGDYGSARSAISSAREHLDHMHEVGSRHGKGPLVRNARNGHERLNSLAAAVDRHESAGTRSPGRGEFALFKSDLDPLDILRAPAKGSFFGGR